MKKGDKGKKVFGLIVILAIIVSVFGGIVSAEDVSEGLTQSDADAEIQTAVGNLSSADQNASIGCLANTRLVVPFFSQRDPSWKNDLMGSSGQTIGQIGCAMTCTAMLLNYYGVNTDPGVLNAWLSTHGGYTSSGTIYWAKPAEYSNGKMHFDSMGGSISDNDNWGVLNDELSNGYPVIVQVDAYPSTPALDSHWVLVTGRAGSQYYINDPYDLSYSSKLLSHFYDSTYDNTFFGWRVYHGSSVVTPPSPPTITSPGTSSEPGEEINTLTPTFRWNSVSNADSYGLYISKYPYGSGSIVFEQEGITGTSLNLPGGYLQDGVKYRWNMKAFNGAGESGYSSRLYFWVHIPQPPSAPTLISPGTSSEPGEEINTLTPTFRWNSVSNADSYGLYISKYPYGSENIIFEQEGITGTSLNLPGGYLQDGVKYRWNMKAFNSVGESSYSGHLYFKVNLKEKIDGIDVSHYQGAIDWPTVYDSGYRFAFAKATGGDDEPPQIIDEQFETNMNEGHNAGVLMGAYHYAYPQYNDAVAEAQFFVSVAGKYLKDGYLRPALDLEEGAALGKEALSNWVHEWMNTVKSETGIEPIIYVNSNYANNYLDSSVTQYDLWIAHWRCDTGTPPNTGIWADWDFWQYYSPDYCGVNSVPGISGGVDLDIFNGDMDRLYTFVIEECCGNMGVNPTTWSPPTLNCGESDSQIVTVSATGGTVEGVMASKISGETWLTLSQTNLGDIPSGSSETFTVTAAPPAGTSSGDYPYTIRVSNTCGTPSSRDVSGTIHVECCGNMGVNPTTWSPPTINCGESNSQIVTVSATGGTVEGVTVSKISGETWLTLSQTNLGDIPSGSSETFTVTAAPPAGTSSGDYPYTIRVSNTCGTPSSKDVTGTITVYCPELSYSPESHDFGDKCEGDTDSTTFEIWNSGTGTLTYSRCESCGWLEVNPTSGSSTGEHDTITVDIDTTSLSEGSHTCDITINSNDGTGTFTVTVTVVPYPESSWTFMVYLDGDNNLESCAIDDFLEMSSVSSTAGVNIVVQFDRRPSYSSAYDDWTTCKRFLVTPGMTPTPANALTDLGECNMGDPNTLSDFVDWAMTQYPADKYALILWDHGSGWKEKKWVPWEDETGIARWICMDDTNGYDYLTLQETEQALAGKSLSLLGYDACLMHMVEVVYQVMDNAGISVGSEESEQGDGWPYNTILSDLTGTPTMTPTTLGTTIVQRYIEFYGTGGDDTQSAVDNGDVSGLVTAVDNLAQALMTEINAGHVADVQQARNAAAEIYYNYYIDLYHFAEMVDTYVPGARTQAQAVMNSMGVAVYEEAHGTSVLNDHGLSIYFPRVEGDYLASYDNTAFAVDTQWNEFLKRYYEGPELVCAGTATSCGIYPNCENCNEKDGCYVYDNGCEERNYYCVSNEAGCSYTPSNRHTDYYDDWDYYCDGDTVRKHRLWHNYYCDAGTCTDHTRMEDDQLVENCNDHDGWVDTGNTDWVDVNECQEKERKEQKYRDYYCSGGACTYSEGGTKWVDTENTRNKPDGTICGCTASNTLKRCYGGVCTDTGICNSSICGADAACDGKEPGDSCGGGGICDSNCKCGGQAVGEDYGIFSAPLWFVDKNGDHLADDVFGYGFTGATPLVGDFNQDGSDDIAVVYLPWWFVDTNGDHIADETFGYGFAGGTPLVGDFNQDGKDDIAVVSLPTWFVDTDRDQVADDTFGYGFAGATPMVGDFNQDGKDDIAVVSLPWWFVDTDRDQVADDTFGYGFAGATPMVGDFNQDGKDDIAVVSLPTWFVDTDRDQVADDTFGYGFAGATPIVGDIG